MQEMRERLEKAVEEQASLYYKPEFKYEWMAEMREQLEKDMDESKPDIKKNILNALDI